MTLDETRNHEHATLWGRLVWEIREQSRTSIPSMLGMLLYKIPWLLSLRFVGNIGSEELAAAALATTLCNVTGMSLSVGLSSAMTTLTGQARGDLAARKDSLLQKRPQSPHFDEKKCSDEEALQVLLVESNQEGADANSTNDEASPLLPLTYLYRGIFIQLMLVIPVGLWWLYGIKPILLYLGQGETLSEMTAVRINLRVIVYAFRPVSAFLTLPHAPLAILMHSRTGTMVLFYQLDPDILATSN